MTVWLHADKRTCFLGNCAHGLLRCLLLHGRCSLIHFAPQRAHAKASLVTQHHRPCIIPVGDPPKTPPVSPASQTPKTDLPRPSTSHQRSPSR